MSRSSRVAAIPPPFEFGAFISSGIHSGKTTSVISNLPARVMTTRSKLAVILHADIVGSTALVQADEIVAHERIRDAFARLSEIVTRYAVIAHEIRGDALVAEFSRASDAVVAALAFQSANGTRNEVLADDIRPGVRIGVALGEVVIADKTVTGSGVVLAQRIEQLAIPGGVCVSAAIHEALPGRLPFDFEGLGDRSLKGFDAPVRIYAVSIGDGESLPDPVAGDGPAVSSAPALAVPAKPSIAVLRFANLSADAEQEFFADGMAEDIITGLSKFRWLFVIARNSSFSFKGDAVDVKVVARELGVRYVLEGSVRRAGPRVRVSSQLIDAETGNHIWAQRFDRELEDLFAIQDEITQAIVSAIAPEIDDAERERARRSSSAEFDTWLLYQRGLSEYYSTRESSLDDAVRIFDRVHAMAPTFAPALAMAAVSRVRITVNFRPDEFEKVMEIAHRQSAEALGLDRKDPMVLWANGRVLSISGEHEQAVAQTEKAIGLNPNYALAHFGLGNALSRCNRPADALEHIDHAIRLSPLDTFLAAFHVVRAWALFLLGEYAECVETSRRAMSIGNATIWAYAILPAALLRSGQRQAAREGLAMLFERQPDFCLAFVERTQRHAHRESLNRLTAALRELGVPE